jgi:hypothetical protein
MHEQVGFLAGQPCHYVDGRWRDGSTEGMIVVSGAGMAGLTCRRDSNVKDGFSSIEYDTSISFLGGEGIPSILP